MADGKDLKESLKEANSFLNIDFFFFKRMTVFYFEEKKLCSNFALTKDIQYPDQYPYTLYTNH